MHEMETLDVNKSSSFFGRSVSYDGIYHIVQSSNPPCTDLNKLESCCQTTRYKIVREEWDHFNTNRWCGDSHADDEVLKFVPRLGLSSTLASIFQAELDSYKTFRHIPRDYWTYISGVSESVVTARLCTGESYDIPRGAITNIDFFGKTEGINSLVLARLVFSNSATGRIAESLAIKLKAEWRSEAEVVSSREDFVAVNKRKVAEFTIPCSGRNCEQRQIRHQSDKWIIYKAQIIEKRFVTTTPIEIWGDNLLTFVATPTIYGAPCGINVDQASVLVRVEYDEKL